ncbi:MAG: lysozyme [Patescibacteria group bacterium]
MCINKAGLDLIKEFEGLRLTSYKCPAGVWTIGIGTTVLPSGIRVGPGMTCTELEAKLYLTFDLKNFEEQVKKLVTVPLNENQFAALVSFAYNCGWQSLQASTLLRLLNHGDYELAAEQFGRWTHGGGVVLPGLVRRREAEKKLFLIPVVAESAVVS